MKLRRPSDWSPPSSDRKPIYVHPDVVSELRDLLFEGDMQGVGYSEFIHRAVAAARREAALTEVVDLLRYGAAYKDGK